MPSFPPPGSVTVCEINRDLITADSIPLDPKHSGASANRKLDLASTLEVGHGGARSVGEAETSCYNLRSVLTIAFQFTFENNLRDTVAAMARQYVRSIVGSVQRVAVAIAPSGLSPQVGLGGFKLFPGSPEALTLARWISRSYRPLHSSRLANQAGLDMLETTFVALQDILLDKILDEAGMKNLCSQFGTIMHQGFAYLPAGLCMSSMNRPVSYEQVVAWRVVTDEDTNHCLAFMFMNWSFV